jgi:hypothetical protein
MSSSIKGMEKRIKMANALEKIEKLEEAVTTISTRLNEVTKTLEQVFPIVDALVAVVGKDTVLEEAKKIAEAARDAHVERVYGEAKKNVEDGKLVEGTEVAAKSLLFVDETPPEGKTSRRLLPVEALSPEAAEKVVGLKVGDNVPLEGIGETKISIAHIFTPAEAA